ncbi:MAG: asparaginase domain-containing protein [Candidatus Gracilibacteria bacterium]|jgi:L-asparaginase|nr:asparaginase domain-containing protein [Candidatus Gracilibacteria bacterium]MDD5179103.1 asparaginase domain-containing protein [Candidatus Gracilibacteria bacterium]
MKIQIINCGGTIDKSYNPAREIFEHTETHFSAMLNQARIKQLEIQAKELFLKDSLDMTEEDFEKITEACEKSTCERILIMQGTSKMVETSKHIASKKLAKTIVFFGAMIPYELAQTDAMFNFGFALAAVEMLPNGVYIAMNGQIFPHDKVKKNGTEATFETA